VLYDFDENIQFKGGFSIHLKTHFQKLLGEETEYPVSFKTNNCELYFETDELENILKRLVENSIDIIHKIQEHPWGQRAMRFYDPDGHIIEIGEPMENVILRFHEQRLSFEDISKRTSMPIKFVEQTVKERNI